MRTGSHTAPMSTTRLSSTRTLTRTVAVMWRAEPAELVVLGRLLGAVVVDGRDAEHPDVVALRPASPETLRGLRRRFPAAELVMVDTDWATAALLPPALVERAFAAGADRYVIALDGLPPTTHRASARGTRRVGRRPEPPFSAAA